MPSPGAAGPLELVYVEGEIRYLDDKKVLAAHEAGWARISNAALRLEETREFVKSIAKDLRKCAFEERTADEQSSALPPR